MKIADARLFHYRLQLVRPLILKSHRLTNREGLVIKLTDQHNHVGWGEIAPLPGFSVETADEARMSAIRILNSASLLDLPEPKDLLKRGIAEYVSTRMPPSVACGLESAVLDLVAHSQGIESRHLIDRSAPDFVSVNGLLTGSKEEVLKRAGQLLANGYTTLKLKVGSESVESEIDKVKSLRSIMPPSVRLRLDANRAWSFETAVEFGTGIRGADIEYIEEPLADSRELEQFHEQTGLAYALDETLVSMSLHNLARTKGLGALILKPTILGGLAITCRFARQAHELGVKSVVSSAFESSLGLTALANLASAVTPNVTCGLDTASWFANDLLSEPLHPAEGRLRLTEYSIDRTVVRSDLLTEIPVA